MSYRWGARAGRRRTLHLTGCRLARFPVPLLDGLTTDQQIIDALGAGIEWTDGCVHCMPKLRRRIAAANNSAQT